MRMPRRSMGTAALCLRLSNRVWTDCWIHEQPECYGLKGQWLFHDIGLAYLWKTQRHLTNTLSSSNKVRSLRFWTRQLSLKEITLAEFEYGKSFTRLGNFNLSGDVLLSTIVHKYVRSLTFLSSDPYVCTSSFKYSNLNVWTFEHLSGIVSCRCVLCAPRQKILYVMQTYVMFLDSCQITRAPESYFK